MQKVDYCNKCDICVQNDFTPHWGIGAENADIMFVHDKPTRRERRLDDVYNGKRYNYLNKLLYAYNFNTTNAYFTHFVKCITPKNREPSLTEFRHCTSYFFNELTIEPKIIVILSVSVAKYMFNDPNYSILQNHGKPVMIGKYLFISTFSPGFLNMNPSKLHLAVKDWEFIYNCYKFIHPTHYKNI